MQETINFASFFFSGYVVQDLNLPVHNFHIFWISLSRVGHANHRIFQHVCTNTYTASPWARWHWRHRWNPSDYDLKLHREAIWTSNDQPTNQDALNHIPEKGGLQFCLQEKEARSEQKFLILFLLVCQHKCLPFFHCLCINSWTYSISYLQSSEILKFAGRLVGLISLLLG